MTDHYDARGRLLDEPDEGADDFRSPGPWRIEDVEDVDVLIASNGVRVAEVLSWRVGDECLLIAAPDLLTALAQMVVNCPVCSRDTRYVEGVRDDGERCYCHPARAVLDRATGGDR